MAGIVPAELQGDPLEVGRGRQRHLLARLDGAGEADFPGHRVGGHPGTELVAAADHVEHARAAPRRGGSRPP